MRLQYNIQLVCQALLCIFYGTEGKQSLHPRRVTSRVAPILSSWKCITHFVGSYSHPKAICVKQQSIIDSLLRRRYPVVIPAAMFERRFKAIWLMFCYSRVQEVRVYRDEIVWRLWIIHSALFDRRLVLRTCENWKVLERLAGTDSWTAQNGGCLFDFDSQLADWFTW